MELESHELKQDLLSSHHQNHNDIKSQDINKDDILISTKDIDSGVIIKNRKRISWRNRLTKIIQKHYTIQVPNKSQSQIQSEKWLLPGLISFNRWILLPTALIIQCCCGSLYSWSVLNKPIDTLIYGPDYNIDMAPITFYIAVGCFGISAAIIGPWLERVGPKRSLIVGSNLFYFGNLVSALGLHLKLIWVILVGYGIISGFGLGLCYMSPVSCLQKWFPDYRGLASGFAVCGFGAGAIVISKIQLPLIELVGLPMTFVVLGSSYFLCLMSCALVLRTPPPPREGSVLAAIEEKPTLTLITLIESITSTTYRLIYFMFFAALLFGLVIISRLSNMVIDIFDKDASEASTVVAINGGFNLMGRLLIPIISDFVGRKNICAILLFLQLIILGCFSTITNSTLYWAFLACIWSVSFCCGGVPGVIPAFLCDQFGSANVGGAYGIILSAWAIAGVGGGLLFTAIFDGIRKDITDGGALNDTWPYNVNVWWIFGIVLLGWTTTLFIKPTKNDVKFLNKVKSLFCGCKL